MATKTRGTNNVALVPVIAVGSTPDRDAEQVRNARIKRKILEKLDLGGRKLNPGVCSVGDCWRYVGGSVNKRSYRQVVDELIRVGEVIEVWGTDETGMMYTHRLLRPGCRFECGGRVIKAIGRSDMIALEYQDLIEADRRFA